MELRLLNCDVRSVRSHRRRARPAFTFLEVLFAIIVLGIGFIMVAAMFPAALQQTRVAVEDTTAGAIWVDAHRKFIDIARTQVVPPKVPPAYVLDLNMPGTGTAGQNDSVIFSFNDADPRLTQPSPTATTATKRQVLWDAARANIILEGDARFACVPMFRRGLDSVGNPSGDALLYLVVVRSRNKPFYSAVGPNANTSDLMAYKGGNYNTAPDRMTNLDPVKFDVTVSSGAGGETISFDKIYDRKPPRLLQNQAVPLSANDTNTPLAPGAYVLICSGPPAKIGNVYQLGDLVPPGNNANLYTIAPSAAGVVDTNGLPYSGLAFVVGKAYKSGAFTGPVQDLAIVQVPLKVKQ